MSEKTRTKRLDTKGEPIEVWQEKRDQIDMTNGEYQTSRSKWGRDKA